MHGGTHITLDGAGFTSGDGGNSTNATASSADSNQAAVQPRCRFVSHSVPATVHGTPFGEGGLVCRAPPAQAPGPAPVLVSLNGVDYTAFPVVGESLS